MQSNDEAVVSIVVDASGLRQGSTEAVALGKRIVDSLKAIETAAQGVGGGLVTASAGVVKSLGDTNKFLGQVERGLNPLQAAANKAQTEMERLIGIIEKGGPAGVRAAASLEAQAQKVLSLKSALTSASDAANGFNAAWAQAEATLQRAIGSLGSLISKFEPASASARQMTNEIANLNASVKQGLVTQEQAIVLEQKITNSYNEGAIAAQRLAESRARLISSSRADQNAINNQNFFNQTLGVNPGSGVGAAAQSASVFQKNFAQDEAELENVKRKTDAAALSIKNASDRIEYLTVKFNQDAVAARTYKNTIVELEEALSKNVIGLREFGLETSKAIDVYNRNTIAGQANKKQIQDTAEAHDKATKSAFLNRVGMMEFQAAIVNTFQATASGMNLTHVAMMEGAQVFGSVVQGTNRGFGIVKDAIVGMATPIGALITGITLITVGFGLAITRAIGIESQIRSLSISMRTLGTDVLSTAADIQNMVPKLQAAGVSRTDAISILQGASQTQGINPQAGVLIGRVGANFAAAFGGTAVDASKKFSEALVGGVDSAVKFALSVNAISGAEASNMLRMAEHGKSMEALREIADKVDQKLRGNLLDSMNSMSKSLLNLKNAWDALFDTLGKSTALQFITDKVTESINAIERLFNLKPPGWLTLAMNVGNPLTGGLGGFITRNIMNPGSGIPATAPSGDLGYLQSAAGPGANIAQLNQTFASRIDAWLSSLSEEEKKNLRITSGFATSGHEPNSLHGLGVAIDVSGLLQSAADKLQAVGLRQNVLDAAVRPHGTHIEPIEIGTAGTTGRDTRISQAQNFVSGTSGLTAQGVIDPNAIKTADFALNEYEETLRKKLDVEKQIGMSADLVTAQQEAQTKALSEHLNPAQADRALTLARADVLNKYAAALDNENKIQDVNIRGTILSASAAREGTAAGLRAQAIAEATNIVFDKYGTIQDHNAEISDKASRIMVKNSSELALAAQMQVASMTPEIVAAERLALAFGKNAATGHEMEITNQAISNTQTLVNAAQARGSDISATQAKRITEENEVGLKKLDILKQTVQIEQGINQRSNQIEVSRLEASLQGQTTEYIQSQVLLLQAAQGLRDKGRDLSETISQNELKSADALGKQNIALADTTRFWNNVNSEVTSIANTIDSTLVKSITDAFDPKKVTDWGKTIKDMLVSIVSQVASTGFIKPLLGTVLSGLGLGQAAQGFGNFNSLLGLGSNSSSGQQIQVGSDGTLKLVGNVASTGNSLFGGSSSGGGLFGNIGSSLGLTPAAGVVNGTGLGSGIFTDLASGATSDIIGSGVSGGLLGDLGLLGGTLGAAIPIAGAVIGGISLLGSLFGLFGSSKPPAARSGSNIDLSTGRIVTPFSGGNAQNDQTANSIANSLSSFASSLIKLTGGTISGGGTTGVVVSTNKGIEINDAFGQMRFGTDSARAISTVELQMAKRLEGVSDTVKKVIDTITDPSQVEAAIQFAVVYDNIKKAADSAFSSISNDTEKLGPFATALEQVNKIFSDLTDTANTFGLSLDPINAALAEATTRLRKDFVNGINDAILAITDPMTLLVKQEKELGKQRLDDAKAIGASEVEVNKLNSLELQKIWDDQTKSLTDLEISLKSGSLSGKTVGDQLKAANDNFKKELDLVRSGSSAEFANFAAAGSSLISAEQAAFGNGPQTAVLRKSVLSAVDEVLSKKSFASGTNSTPEGWIRVGENGPEWMHQDGGAKILPFGKMPNQSGGDNTELVNELKMVRSLLESANNISRGVGVETVGHLGKINKNTEKTVPISDPIRQKA